jgi:hypothetical protein
MSPKALLDRRQPFISEASKRFAVPQNWIRAVIRIESGGRTVLFGKPITSGAGAMGLMQLMRATYDEMRTRNGLGAGPYNRLGMRRFTPLLEQVSSSLSPKRTCEFPRIRLSVRDLRRGERFACRRFRAPCKPAHFVLCPARKLYIPCREYSRRLRKSSQMNEYLMRFHRQVIQAPLARVPDADAGPNLHLP